jgi:exodeoxyribonuclease VII large subunit
LVVTSPVPVFTGIGHERDNTILDEVSHTRFDTPSKVVAHVLKVITFVAQQGDSNMQAITTAGQRRVLQATKNADADHYRIITGTKHALIVAEAGAREESDAVTQLARRQVEHADMRTRQLVIDVQQGATWRPIRALEAADRMLTDARREAIALVDRHAKEARRLLGDVGVDGIDLVQREAVDADRLLADIRHGCAWRPMRALEAADRIGTDIWRMTHQEIDRAILESQSMIEAIITRGPKNTLARGYTIARVSGKVISSAEKLRRVEDLELEFRDGRILVRRNA